jgi:iron(III) transport system substrate-binding protein
MNKKIVIIILIVAIVALPFIFRQEREKIFEADDELIVVSAHQGSTRFEFTIAFKEWYLKRTGRTVKLDWRKPGGASEIVKYLSSHFENSFRLYWENELKRPWTFTVQKNYLNTKIVLGDDPSKDTEAEAARRAFLESNASCDIDVWFGGGDYDFKIAASQGKLVPARVFKEYPEWFKDEIYPHYFGGDLMWETDGRWFGVVFSSFGFVYNEDVFKRINYPGTPDRWSDLARPELINELCLADPTKSGSVSKAFEVIVQEQMQRVANDYESKGYKVYKADKNSAGKRLEPWVLEEGWNRAMQMVQLFAANARNFTDEAGKAVLAVASGNAGFALALDFYARYQMQNIKERIGYVWMELVLPKGGTAVSPDCIALFKGAPHKEVAELFIEFVLSPEGQKLWFLEPGTPGGPVKYALRRMPERRDIYTKEVLEHAVDKVNPYVELDFFVYQTEWTGPYSVELRFVIRSAFIDARDELNRAWGAIIAARKEGRTDDADEAFAIMQDLSEVSYKKVQTTISKALKGGDPLEEIRLSSYLTNHYIAQYDRAYAVAKGRK